MTTHPKKTIATNTEGQVLESTYRGWHTLCLQNDLINVQVAPTIGGRIIQFSLRDYEYFWVNNELGGTVPDGAAIANDGEVNNYGGEKLWPAPQAWQTGVYAQYCEFKGLPLADKNPGPPMPDIDDIPHTGELLSNGIRLTSPKSQQFGIQFTRDIKLFDDSTRVSVSATMKNVDTQPHRWGIWSVAQVNATRTDGRLNNAIRTYIPINRNSMFPKGYEQIYGQVGTLQFQPDYDRGIMCVHFQNEVAKLGMDASDGWVATVDGETGHVFVQQFTYHPGEPYPDNASVEVWLHGKGSFYGYDALIDMGEEPPHLIESEILSPFANLQPDEAYVYDYDMCATNVGGDFPILDCSAAGVTAESLSMTNVNDGLTLAGRFGVFYRGRASLRFLNRNGVEIGESDVLQEVTPEYPFVLEESTLSTVENVPLETSSMALQLKDRQGRLIDDLTQVQIAL